MWVRRGWGREQHHHGHRHPSRSLEIGEKWKVWFLKSASCREVKHVTGSRKCWKSLDRKISHDKDSKKTSRVSFELHLLFFLNFLSFFKLSAFFYFSLRCVALVKCPNKNSALRNNHDYTFHNNTQRTRRTRGNTNDAVYKKLNIVSEKRFYTKVMMKRFLTTSWRRFVFTKGLIPLTCSLFLQYLKVLRHQMCLRRYLRLSFRPKSQKELPQNRLYKYIEKKHNQKNNKRIWYLKWFKL